MSGITPLIDTLLHQVLGRQGEVSSQRVLNAPVQPVLPGEGPRADVRVRVAFHPFSRAVPV